MSTTPQNTHHDNYLEIERWCDDGLELLAGMNDPTFASIKMRFLKHIHQDKNFIAARTGNITAIGMHDSGETNPLLNNGPKRIMGKVVGQSAPPVTAASLTPAKDDTRKFKADVNDLYNGFLGLKDADVIAILSKPGGSMLLRGVAKKAHVPNFDSIGTEDMDISFFADIRAGIKDNAKGKALTASLEDKLADNEAEEEETEEMVPTPKKAAAKKAVAPKKAAAKKADLLDDDDA